jgi:hypothetical protein
VELHASGLGIELAVIVVGKLHEVGDFGLQFPFEVGQNVGNEPYVTVYVALLGFFFGIMLGE